MTKYVLMLRATVAERATASRAFERGRKSWADSLVVLMASTAAALAAGLLAVWRGDDAAPAVVLGLVGAAASQIVWIVAGQIRTRKYLTALTGSAIHRGPVAITLGPEGVTFATAHFPWSDFRAAQRLGSMTLLATSDFDGLVIRDQDLSPDLTPDLLQTLILQWKSA